jgi:hypothetical protein
LVLFGSAGFLRRSWLGPDRMGLAGKSSTLRESAPHKKPRQGGA